MLPMVRRRWPTKRPWSQPPNGRADCPHKVGQRNTECCRVVLRAPTADGRHSLKTGVTSQRLRMDPTDIPSQKAQIQPRPFLTRLSHLVYRIPQIQKTATNVESRRPILSRSQIGRSQGVSARAASMNVAAMIAALTPFDALGEANPPGSPRHRSIPHRSNRASETATYPGAKARGNVQRRCRLRRVKWRRMNRGQGFASSGSVDMPQE